MVTKRGGVEFYLDSISVFIVDTFVNVISTGVTIMAEKVIPGKDTSALKKLEELHEPSSF